MNDYVGKIQQSYIQQSYCMKLRGKQRLKKTQPTKKKKNQPPKLTKMWMIGSHKQVSIVQWSW